MSAKYFHWEGGVSKLLDGEKYAQTHGGNPVEFQIHSQPILVVQGWHAISQDQRIALIARLIAAGWIEGEQSKPDE
jgi:hypothetical protein